MAEPGDEHFFTSSQTIVWRQHGSADGVPVVFFGGTPGSVLEGQFAQRAAADAGIRLIVIERPGMGESTRQKRATLADCSRQFLDLLDSLEIARFSVIGYSAGGLYALGLAHAGGERVRMVADLAGPAPVYEPELRALLPPLVKLPGYYELLYGALSLAARRMDDGRLAILLRDKLCAGADRRWLGDDQVARSFARSFRRGLAQGGLGCAQDILRVYRPWGFRLEEVEIPVHVWYGDDDQRMPRAFVDHKLARLPKAVLHSCPGAGHLDLLDRLDEVFAVVLKDETGKRAVPTLPLLGGC
jgi:pimeloyl-ACP methyl ester carboxylesterase